MRILKTQQTLTFSNYIREEEMMNNDGGSCKKRARDQLYSDENSNSPKLHQLPITVCLI
jgi:hypothetical protein